MMVNKFIYNKKMKKVLHWVRMLYKYVQDKEFMKHILQSCIR